MLFPIKKVLPASGMKIDAYPHPDQPESWVLNIRSLDEKTSYAKVISAHPIAMSVPEAGACIEAMPVQDGQWSVSYYHNDCIEPQTNFVCDGSTSILTVLKRIFADAGMIALLPILREGAAYVKANG